MTSSVCLWAFYGSVWDIKYLKNTSLPISGTFIISKALCHCWTTWKCGIFRNLCVGTPFWNLFPYLLCHYGAECLKFLSWWEFIWKMVKPKEDMHFYTCLSVDISYDIFSVRIESSLSYCEALFGQFFEALLWGFTCLLVGTSSFMTAVLLGWRCSFCCVYVP